MAKSVAKKMRDHRVRQGKSNPSSMRGSWNGVNPFIRTTPTLSERLMKTENKHNKKSIDND